MDTNTAKHFLGKIDRAENNLMPKVQVRFVVIRQICQ